MKSVANIGIIYNPRAPDARGLVAALSEQINVNGRGAPHRAAWVCSAADVDPGLPEGKDTDLIITVGGDGTIIRAARLSIPHGIPILGVNMGRLGFMTELKADEALEKVPQYLEGTTRVEERNMLQVHTSSGSTPDNAWPTSTVDATGFHALNDVVVGRGGVSRLIKIGAFIDGTHLTDFRADAVIVSTATGSTGYNLSVGGPILWPEAGEIVLKAVAPHVGMAPALVLPSTSVVELTVETDHETILSVDGYMDFKLAACDRVTVQKSPHRARFLRANPPTHFYATLTQRLGFGGGQSSTRAIQY